MVERVYSQHARPIVRDNGENREKAFDTLHFIR